MAKFKVGDRVKVVSGDDCKGLTGRVLDTSSAPYIEFDQKVTNGHSGGGRGKYGFVRSINEDDLELVGVGTPEPTQEVHFILQYELDRDPLETFSTLAEVKSRIKELAERSDLKKDSIRVYEVAKVHTVTLETRINLHSLTEGKRRGRPKGSKNAPKKK